MVVEENLAIFKRSGFDLQVDMGAPPGKRVMLAALPFSKGTGARTRMLTYADVC
jgi:hypothetical protein